MCLKIVKLQMSYDKLREPMISPKSGPLAGIRRMISLAVLSPYPIPFKFKFSDYIHLDTPHTQRVIKHRKPTPTKGAYPFGLALFA